MGASAIRRAGTYSTRRIAAAVASGVASYATNRFLKKKPTTSAPLPPALRSTAKRRGGYAARQSITKKPTVRKLAKKVQTLTREVNSSRAELLYHVRSTGRVLSAVNQTTHLEILALGVTAYENAAAQQRYFDSAAPGTLVTADGSSGTYSRKCHFKSVYSAVEVRNNYQVPCKIVAYICAPKEDTSLSPTTCFTNGLADVGNPASTSPMVHFTDSPQLLSQWRLVKTIKKALAPGQTCNFSHATKDIFYDPSVVDSVTSTYQPKYKCFSIVLRVEGVYGHDTSADEQGQLAAGIDWAVHTKITCHYDAGADFTYIYISDSSDTFTNGGVIASKPVSDNIGYSVA